VLDHDETGIPEMSGQVMARPLAMSGNGVVTRGTGGKADLHVAPLG
jgi:hypothetical protein